MKKLAYIFSIVLFSSGCLPFIYENHDIILGQINHWRLQVYMQTDEAKSNTPIIQIKNRIIRFLIINYSSPASSFLFFSGGKFSSQTLFDGSISSFSSWSPSTVVSGQNENAGHIFRIQPLRQWDRLSCVSLPSMR